MVALKRMFNNRNTHTKQNRNHVLSPFHNELKNKLTIRKSIIKFIQKVYFDREYECELALGGGGGVKKRVSP